MPTPTTHVSEMYPVTAGHVPQSIRSDLIDSLLDRHVQTSFPAAIRNLVQAGLLPSYFEPLVDIEETMQDLANNQNTSCQQADTWIVNPNLYLLPVPWTGLDDLFESGKADDVEPGDATLVIWKHPEGGVVQVQEATADDLLALKIVAEEVQIQDIAREYDIQAFHVHNVLVRASDKGILLSPQPQISRDPEIFISPELTGSRFQSPKVFTLQWHITQACDLRCKHCYDRSSRSGLPVEQALWVLDELEEFCLANNVRGKITFTGGNPLLYPNFEAVYAQAARKGFSLSILGNPASREQIERLAAIQSPGFYQVSLEGLPEHNDHIRQPGHFERTMEFLDLLSELEIPSQVMLTLTKENMDQIIPLGERLRGRTDHFTFNRLSMVGEGARLLLPEKDEFQAFLRDYQAAAKDNPVLGIKDNLINILRYEQGRKPFGGCTGFGCGAAFNFVALLPDGEVHACRKFPSQIGNILDNSLQTIYDSSAAQRYRTGSEACAGCSLRPVCGGCQAITSSMGLNIGKDRDPYCFMFDAVPDAGSSIYPNEVTAEDIALAS